MAQFNRQNPAQWLNNLAMLKSKSCGRSVSGGCKGSGGGGMDGFLVSDSLDDMVGLDSGVELPWDGKDSEVDMGMTRGSPLGPSPGPGANAPSPSLASLQPSLQGVKVCNIRNNIDVLLLLHPMSFKLYFTSDIINLTSITNSAF